MGLLRGRRSIAAFDPWRDGALRLRANCRIFALPLLLVRSSLQGSERDRRPAMYWMLLPPNANVGRGMADDDPSVFSAWREAWRVGWRRLTAMFGAM